MRKERDAELELETLTSKDDETANTILIIYIHGNWSGSVSIALICVTH